MAKWGIAIVGSAEVPIRTSEALVPRTTAQELGVAYMIQGSVHGTADRIAVSLQLIDVENGVQVWSERFEIELGDAMNGRNETCRLIGRIIFRKLSLDANRRIEALPPHEWTSSDSYPSWTHLIVWSDGHRDLAMMPSETLSRRSLAILIGLLLDSELLCALIIEIADFG